MRDLCEIITQNQTKTYQKRRKEKKGSQLARYALRHALGSDKSLYDSDLSNSFKTSIEDYADAFSFDRFKSE